MGDHAQRNTETTRKDGARPESQPSSGNQRAASNGAQRAALPATQGQVRAGGGTIPARKATESSGYSPPRKKAASSPADGDVNMANRSSNAYKQRIMTAGAEPEERDYVADFRAANAQNSYRGTHGMAAQQYASSGTHAAAQGINQQVRCTAMQHNNGVNLWRWHAHTARTLRCTPDLKRLVYAVRSSKPTTRALAMRGSLRTKRNNLYVAALYVVVLHA